MLSGLLIFFLSLFSDRGVLFNEMVSSLGIYILDTIRSVVTCMLFDGAVHLLLMFDTN